MAKPTNKDYLAIAKRRVTQPSKTQRARRFLVYGKNKKGKTKLGLSNGVKQTLVLDPEHGTDLYRTLDPYVWHLRKWEEVQEAWGALRTGELSPHLLGVGPEKEPFHTLLVDGTTRMNNMALKFVGRQAEARDLDRVPGMVDRRDYNKSGELMKEMMLHFHSLANMTVIFTAQERSIKVDDKDINLDELNNERAYYVADVPDGVRGALNSIVDVIGRLYVERVTVNLPGGGQAERMQRRLWIGLHEQYDTGFRSEYQLPDFVKKPTIPKLLNLMLTGTERGDS